MIIEIASNASLHTKVVLEGNINGQVDLFHDFMFTMVLWQLQLQICVKLSSS